MDSIKDMDAVVLAVAHREFSAISVERMNEFLGTEKRVLLDIKGIADRKEFDGAGYFYWRL